MFIKHNDRWLRWKENPDGSGRQTCGNCQQKVYYWAHDTSAHGNGVNGCSVHNSYSWIYLTVDAKPIKVGGQVDYRYAHFCPDETTVRYWDGPKPGKGDNGEDDYPTPKPEVKPEPKPEVKAEVKADGNDPLAALRAVIATVVTEIATGLVDTLVESKLGKMLAQLRADILSKTGEMIKDALGEIGALPTRVEVKRADGSVHKVEGIAHKVLPEIITLLQIPNRNLFLAGPAGTGKTHICGQAAKALGLPFFAMSVGPTMTESRIQGYMDATGTFISTPFYDWCKKGGLFLLDEADSGNAGVLTVLNAALSNRFYTFPNGERVELHETCRCAVGANTFGRGADRVYVGRNALDGAFLNRFSFVPVDVDEALERALCLGTGLAEAKVDRALRYVRHLRKNVSDAKLPAVIGPRNAIRLCEDLVYGIAVERAVELEVRCGISDVDWMKITANAPSVYSI